MVGVENDAFEAVVGVRDGSATEEGVLAEGVASRAAQDPGGAAARGCGGVAAIGVLLVLQPADRLEDDCGVA